MLNQLQFESNKLVMHWQDGSTDSFTCDWLRDNAPDVRVNSGQKSYSILDIPEQYCGQFFENSTLMHQGLHRKG